MTYVDEAFEKCKSTLNVTKTETSFASSKHQDIRSVVRDTWELDDDFLTGSYRRETKTKRLKDVDIFVVLKPGGAQAGLRKQPPTQVLRQLEQVLSNRYDHISSDGFACTVQFGSEDEVASFDVVPAFKRTTTGWEIPDADRGRWISTNPKRHHEYCTKKNAECDGRFVPFVKMIKGINRQAEEPIQPPFLLEVMAYELIQAPFGRYQDEIRWFLATAGDRITEDWADPAGIGPDVNEQMTSSQRQQVRTVLLEWLEISEEAVRLEDDGQERSAVEEWRRLFGWRMPRP